MSVAELDTWQKTNLGSVCKLLNGRAYKKHELLDSGKYPVLRVGNFFSNRSWYFSDLDLPENKYCDKGDLLYAWSASFGPRIWEGGKVIYHYHIWKIELDEEKIDKQFLYHWFNWDVDRIRTEQGTGATMIHVTKSAMENRALSLPPLSEQKRIADILDKADAIRRKRQQAIEEAKTFVTSLFSTTFGFIVENSKNWQVVPFGSVCDSRLGKMLDAKQQTGQHLRKYLRNTNVQWNRFQIDEMLEMDFDEKARKEFELKDGDLLICEGGEIGRCAIWRNELAECYFQKALHRVRPDLKKVVPEYLLHFMWEMSKYDGFRFLKSQATIAHLTGVKLKKLDLPLPPIELQREFATRIEGHQKAIQNYQAALSESTQLFNSLVQRTFKGEL